MLSSLLAAPMAWHDGNPSGRVLNRCGDDQAKVDVNLPFAVGSIFATTFNVAGDLVVAAAVTRWLVLLLLPLSVVYAWIGRRYLSKPSKSSLALTFLTPCLLPFLQRSRGKCSAW